MRTLFNQTVKVLRKVNTQVDGGRTKTEYVPHIENYKCRRTRYSKGIVFDAPGGMVVTNIVTFSGPVADIKDDDRFVWDNVVYRVKVRPIYSREKLHHMEFDGIKIGKVSASNGS